MTDRLTDDEIRELRELSKLVPPAPWGEDALARLLDEIEERRRWAVAASRVVVWARGPDGRRVLQQLAEELAK